MVGSFTRAPSATSTRLFTWPDVAFLGRKRMTVPPIRA
jgi:hypothetical protein